MKQIASIIDRVLKASKPGVTKSGAPSKANVVVDPAVKSEIQKEVDAILHKFVLYPELDLDYLKSVYC